MRLNTFLAHNVPTRHHFGVGFHHVTNGAKLIVREVLFVDNLAAHNDGSFSLLLLRQSSGHVFGLDLPDHSFEIRNEAAKSLHDTLVVSHELPVRSVVDNAQ